MIIGGTDTVLRLPALYRRHWGFLRDAVMRFVTLWWTDCVMDGGAPDFFYYENQAARESWTAHGRLDENADKMLHVVHSGADTITVVTDGPQTTKLLADLIQMLERNPHVYGPLTVSGIDDTEPCGNTSDGLLWRDLGYKPRGNREFQREILGVPVPVDEGETDG